MKDFVGYLFGLLCYPGTVLNKLPSPAMLNAGPELLFARLLCLESVWYRKGSTGVLGQEGSVTLLLMTRA